MSKRLGAGVSSAHSLASDTSEGTRRRVRRKGGKETAISPALDVRHKGLLNLNSRQ